MKPLTNLAQWQALHKRRNRNDIGTISCSDLPHRLDRSCHRQRRIQVGFFMGAVGDLRSAHRWRLDFIGSLTMSITLLLIIILIVVLLGGHGYYNWGNGPSGAVGLIIVILVVLLLLGKI